MTWHCASRSCAREFVLSDERADLIEQGIDVAIRNGKVVEPTLVAAASAPGG